jgi:two-component system, cell cycle sensor histidine kinase and response regulator CckA
MGGQELAEHLAERCPGIKVVFMSGYPGRITSERGAPSADAPFLQKPFSLDELGRTIREALDRPPK